MGRFALGKFHSLASKLTKITVNYTHTKSNKYKNIRADYSPSYLYRLGLQSLDSAEYVTGQIGSTEDNYGNDFSAGTSIKLSNYVVPDLNFKYKNSFFIPSTGTMTKNESYTYYPLGDRGKEGLPIPNWGVTISKVEKWWILEKFFQSVTLNHRLTGEISNSYQDVNNDKTMTEDEKVNEQYSLSYSPIIGIRTTSKGYNPIKMVANYDRGQTINNENKYTEKNYNNQIRISFTYVKTGGIKIDKVFFFRDFYIKNKIDFTLTFTHDTSRKRKTTNYELYDFNEETNNKSWSIKPNVGYTFTRWVTGNIYVSYGVTENRTTGRKEERDFGFNMNIKIQG